MFLKIFIFFIFASPLPSIIPNSRFVLNKGLLKRQMSLVTIFLHLDLTYIQMYRLCA